MRKRLTLALAAVLGFSTQIQAQTSEPVRDNWSHMMTQARGQSVYFNAWGGSEVINNYLNWAAEQLKKEYGVTLIHVKVSDAANTVKRIETEFNAGKTAEGSIDLVWINGENFQRLQSQNLLYGPWVNAQPNWQYVAQDKPVTVDFSVPTEGYESPWGTAQLTFIANRTITETPPKSAMALLEFARQNPGKVSYPLLPDFHGTTFLKQLLIELSNYAPELQQPVTADNFQHISQPLWAYLDKLHPFLWRKAATFPATISEMHRMLGDGELSLSMTFNPNEAANLVAQHQLPPTVYSFGFSQGTIGNVHFLAIPKNSRAKAGAQIVANFLLSPEAQARKADITIWGDDTVLDKSKLSEQQQQLFNSNATAGLIEPVPTLSEPHASWVNAIEKEWITRYGVSK
jgi:putative thiamine transport system substrate-binding protein